MAEKIKSLLNTKSILVLVSWVMALVGLIIYLVVATTGFFAGSAPNGMVLTFAILFLAATCLYVLFGQKLGRFDFAASFLLAAALITAFVFFVFDKEEVVGDMLIPVNHPAAQVNAATASIVGIVFFALSILVFAASCFMDKKASAAE